MERCETKCIENGNKSKTLPAFSKNNVHKNVSKFSRMRTQILGTCFTYG